MSFGQRILQARKGMNLSQEALAKALKATPTTVGRYERDEVKPSIEVAAKIAATLEVSLDYLVGTTDRYLKDQKMLHRLEELDALTDYDKERILYTLDGLLRDAKTRHAYAS
jgi:transcriptional regulator with XRE-family HTH domain